MLTRAHAPGYRILFFGTIGASLYYLVSGRLPAVHWSETRSGSWVGCAEGEMGKAPLVSIHCTKLRFSAAARPLLRACSLVPALCSYTRSALLTCRRGFVTLEGAEFSRFVLILSIHVRRSSGKCLALYGVGHEMKTCSGPACLLSVSIHHV